MFTRDFWATAAERAIKTIAQSLLAVLALGTTLWGVDWAEAIGIALLAGLISILTSIAGPKGDDGAVRDLARKRTPDTVAAEQTHWGRVDGED